MYYIWSIKIILCKHFHNIIKLTFNLIMYRATVGGIVDKTEASFLIIKCLTFTALLHFILNSLPMWAAIGRMMKLFLFL